MFDNVDLYFVLSIVIAYLLGSISPSILLAKAKGIDIKKEGKSLMIGFNPKFLIDALKVIDDETIDMYMFNSKAPCFIKKDDMSYVYVVLPVTISGTV